MSGHKVLADIFSDDGLIKDPVGTDEYLPVTRDNLIFAFTGAATRKLANCDQPNVELTLEMQTADDVVITADETFDGTNNTLTFTDLVDYAVLKSVKEDLTNGGWEWRVIVNNGGALSSV